MHPQRLRTERTSRQRERNSHVNTAERSKNRRAARATRTVHEPPEAGLGRRASSADRLEAEPAQFHERVRAAFLALASAEPVRYVVLDATRDPTQLSKTVQAALRERLPDPVPERAEEITGSIPVIRE